MISRALEDSFCEVVCLSNFEYAPAQVFVLGAVWVLPVSVLTSGSSNIEGWGSGLKCYIYTYLGIYLKFSSRSCPGLGVHNSSHMAPGTRIKASKISKQKLIKTHWSLFQGSSKVYSPTLSIEDLKIFMMPQAETNCRAGMWAPEMWTPRLSTYIHSYLGRYPVTLIDVSAHYVCGPRDG